MRRRTHDSKSLQSDMHPLILSRATIMWRFTSSCERWHSDLTPPHKTGDIGVVGELQHQCLGPNASCSDGVTSCALADADQREPGSSPAEPTRTWPCSVTMISSSDHLSRS